MKSKLLLLATCLLVWAIPVSADVGDVCDKDCRSSLNKAEKFLEGFGFASMGTLTLQAPSSDFAFDLDKQNANEYFNDAKSGRQGSLARSVQSIVKGSVSADVQIDETVAPFLGAALEKRKLENAEAEQRRILINERDDMVRALVLKEYERALATADELEGEARAAAVDKAREDFIVNYPIPEQMHVSAVPTSKDLPGQPEASAPDVLPVNYSGAEPFSLLGDFKSTVANRSAITIAAADNALEAIFRILGNQSVTKDLDGNHVYYGVATVSVNPGNITRTGYAMRVTMSANVEKNKGERVASGTTAAFVKDFELSTSRNNTVKSSFVKQLENAPQCGESFPVGDVTVLSPFTQVQTLDFAGSRRSESEMAFAVSAALAQAGRDNSAKMFLNYAKKKQQDVKTVTPSNFVNTFGFGNNFGFEFGPRLVAAGVDRGARNVLQRDSFPVLLRLRLPQENMTGVCRDGENSSDYYRYVSELRVIQTREWLPTEALNGFLQAHKRLWRNVRDTKESKREKWRGNLELLAASATDPYLKQRANEYYEKIFTTSQRIGLPHPSVVVNSVSPSTIKPPKADDTKMSFLLKGVGFDRLKPDSFELVSDPSRTVSVTLLSDSALQLQLGVNKADTELLFIGYSSDARRISTVEAPIKVKASKPGTLPQPAITHVLPNQVKVNQLPASLDFVVVGENLHLLDLPSADAARDIEVLSTSKDKKTLTLRLNIVDPSQPLSITFKRSSDSALVATHAVGIGVNALALQLGEEGNNFTHNIWLPEYSKEMIEAATPLIKSLAEKDKPTLIINKEAGSDE